jgi:hypothetical protein
MKKYYLSALMMLLLLFPASGLVLAQDATAEPTSEGAVLPIPTQPLLPCPEEVTPTTICDVIASQPEDIVGVWTLYFESHPVFIRYTLDGTYLIADSPEHTADITTANASGPYSFDDEGVFTSVFTGAPLSEIPLECQAGRYILRVIKVGGQPVALNHAVIEDCFGKRETDWRYTMLWVSAE